MHNCSELARFSERSLLDKIRYVRNDHHDHHDAENHSGVLISARTWVGSGPSQLLETVFGSFLKSILPGASRNFESITS